MYRLALKHIENPVKVIKEEIMTKLNRPKIKDAIVNRGKAHDHEYANFRQVVFGLRLSSKNLLKIVFLDSYTFDSWCRGNIEDTERTHRFIEDIDLDIMNQNEVLKYYIIKQNK